jgi:DNA ligase (NAD+)
MMATRITSLTQAKHYADGVLEGKIEPTSDRLAEVLSLASDAYYNVESADLDDPRAARRPVEPFLTDTEFNLLQENLRNLNPNDPFLAQVGSDVRGEKIDLPYVMGSLDQVYSGEAVKWVQQNSWQNQQFCLTDKADGTSALLVYGRNGLFQIAYSRGNGYQGADITRHIKRIPGVPKKVSRPCAIRAEVILHEDVFLAFANESRINGKRVYKNARNYVAGRMNAKESPGWFYENVKVIGTSVIDPEMGKEEQLQFMQKAGFEIPAYAMVSGSDLTDEKLTQYVYKRKQVTPYAIDGIVIDVNDHDIRVGLWRKSSSINPVYSRKFKVGDTVATPRVRRVVWEPSKDAYLKPTIQLEPVDLGGVTISNCTGFNAAFIRDKKIGPGAMIELVRAGDVIPFCRDVLEPANEPQMPTEAEFGEMVWTEGDVDLVLANPKDNPTVQKNILIEVFTRLEVPGLRAGNIEKLYDADYTTAEAVIKMSEKELHAVLGNSAGERVYTGIREKLNPIELWNLAGSSQKLGRGMGRRRMKRLMEDLPDTKDWTVQKIVLVEGFELTTAKTIVRNLPRFVQFLDEIKGYYTLKAPAAKVVGGKLDGFKVCFTGVRSKDLEAKIAAAGGEIVTGVNKDTTHLVCKDVTSTSGKMAKAAELAKAGSLKILTLKEAEQLWS